LKELPAGRPPISTTVVPISEKPTWLDRVWLRVREEVARGQQVYIVCPRIGQDDDLEVAEYGAPSDADSVQTASVLGTAAELIAGQLIGLRVGVLHGRLPSDEKSRVMLAFAGGECDVLVATTVIEVGVDVANATVMVIADADRFGVSQLHQLRGRVGRGRQPGLCLLLTQLPAGHPSRERLDSVASTTDGFKLARLDLIQRREGDVLGATQSGRQSQFKLLSLLQDEKLIISARSEARRVIESDPTLTDHAELRELLWESFDSESAEYLHKS
jgi:ATP-dependent DNA helicase RecG